MQILLAHHFINPLTLIFRLRVSCTIGYKTFTAKHRNSLDSESSVVIAFYNPSVFNAYICFEDGIHVVHPNYEISMLIYSKHVDAEMNIQTSPV